MGSMFSKSSGMSNNQMVELQFNLKMASKQMTNTSKKHEQKENQEKKKAKQSLAKGNIDGAKIYAQNAIRAKNDSLNFLRLASRLDAVASRIENARTMAQVTKQMGVVVSGMDKALESMNVNEITQVMDKFETQFNDLDVISSYTENAIGQTTALTTPEGEVNSLLSQIADENSLDYQAQMNTGLGNV